ncbi:MAG: MBL fold metallo-hydrolase [Bacilli bacterium]|nr:MBL fold metallo-hydrolase [Bacilli bacterium]
MKICVLSSGSKGNCTYVETSSHKYLLDLGRNKKYIVDKLKEIDVSPSEIDYIIISHSHDDHISALETFIKAYKTSVCVTNDMLKNIPLLKNYENLIVYDDDMNFGEDLIESIKSSHDSNDARNFIISDGLKSVAYVTDTGYINQKYFKKLSNHDVYLFESNHDIEMLNNGPYPSWLKARVLSDKGHLSNIAAGVYLSKLIGDKTKNVILIHLSETNNTSKLALDTVTDVFKEYELDFKNLSCAYQNEISEVINI